MNDMSVKNRAVTETSKRVSARHGGKKKIKNFKNTKAQEKQIRL